MKYIGGADYKNKTIKIKRQNNDKWYPGDVILKQITDFLNKAEPCKLKRQFVQEYEEIRKLYKAFGMTIKKHLTYKEDTD